MQYWKHATICIAGVLGFYPTDTQWHEFLTKGRDGTGSENYFAGRDHPPVKGAGHRHRGVQPPGPRFLDRRHQVSG